MEMHINIKDVDHTVSLGRTGDGMSLPKAVLERIKPDSVLIFDKGESGGCIAVFHTANNTVVISGAGGGE
ncbi:hypothetical protein HAP94_02055 [Acidithiobacillus ferrivorans]|nr:hypothetical protein [Acidithiobacillus ferrivorans]